MDPNKSKPFSIRLNDEQIKILKCQATARNMKMSEITTLALNEYFENNKLTDKQAIVYNMLLETLSNEE